MSLSSSDIHLYYPPDVFPKAECERSRADWVLMILNQPVSRRAILKSFMKTCGYRVCVDGGANRLLEVIRCGKLSAGPSEGDEEIYLPDIIHGDLDSLRDDVREFYAKQGVDISLDEDQESTDFGKGMNKIYEYDDHVRSTSRVNSSRPGDVNLEYIDSSSTSILVFCTMSGRLDQGLGLLSEMIREQSPRPKLRFYLIGESSFSFLLARGENMIDFSRDSRNSTEETRQAKQPVKSELSPITDGKFKEGLFTRNVGIIPIAGPAVITTQGLEWDVKDWETSMGGKVSTSNHIVDNVIHIWTDRMVLFTVELGADNQS